VIGNDSQMVMIGVSHQQHGGSFLIISWDPRISAADTEVRSSFYFHEIGSLVEHFFEELIELLQD
jgi:hypothetical protein